MAGRGFASDNASGAHPDVLHALVCANTGHAPSYGADAWTARAKERFRVLFGDDVEVFFVYNGTAANVLGLAPLVRPHQAVYCSDVAHVATDECGAPERFLGSKLVPVPAPHGKLAPALLDPHVKGVGFEHHVQPGALTLTQATELGTVYTVQETRALCEWAHARGMRVHVDGARIANAAASLGAPLRALTRDAGVDVLSFGGTKNGLVLGEALVFFDADLARDFAYVRKQGMQLHSKMRFVGAQFDALLADDLWLRNARHANAMARRLAAGAAAAGAQVTHPVEANAVFARLPPAAVPALQAVAPFYVWDEAASEVRWVCSFDTTEEDVDAFVAALARLLA